MVEELRVVDHVGAVDPLVPAVVQRWRLPLASAMIVPAGTAMLAVHDGLAAPIAAGIVTPAELAKSPSSCIVMPAAP